MESGCDNATSLNDLRRLDVLVDTSYTTEQLEDSALPKKIMHFVAGHNHSVSIAEDKELYVGKELKWSTWL